MGKFDSVIAQAAYEVSLNGFAVSEHGSVDEPGGYNALVVTSPVTMMNLGWDVSDVAAYREAAGDYEIDVWITVDEQGFVSVVHSGFNVERAFEKYVDSIVESEGEGDNE